MRPAFFFAAGFGPGVVFAFVAGLVVAAYVVFVPREDVASPLRFARAFVTLGRCSSRSEVGQPCGGDCVLDAFCHADATCHAYLAPDAPCDVSSVCTPGYGCVAGRCTAARTIGERCTADSERLVGSCVGSRCVPCAN